LGTVISTNPVAFAGGVRVTEPLLAVEATVRFEDAG
jgi:hypothetical protein